MTLLTALTHAFPLDSDLTCLRLELTWESKSSRVENMLEANSGHKEASG